MSASSFIPDTAPLEVLPRDLSAYRAGNTGIDYVHRFECGPAARMCWSMR